MLGGKYAMMQWTGQHTAGGAMYTHHMTGPLRPPPPLIDMRKFNQPEFNQVEPNTDASVPPAKCLVPPVKCIVPPVNCQAPPMPFKEPNVSMQQDNTGSYFMCDYWPSPTYPHRQILSDTAYTRFNMGPAPIYTQFTTSYSTMPPNGNGVARSAQEQRSSIRYAPYTAHKSAQSGSTRLVPMKQDYHPGLKGSPWTPQRESTRKLAEKIWRRRLESYLNKLNGGSQAACVATQQILNDELTQRSRNGSMDRTVGSRRSPPYASTPIPMTTNPGQDAYSRLYVNTSPPVPATTCIQQNSRQNVYSPSCFENISPPLSGQWENMWYNTQPAVGLGMLPVTNSGLCVPLTTTCVQLPRGSSSATSCSQVARGTSSTTSCVQRSCGSSHDAVKCSNFETIDTMFFRKFPCSLFKKKTPKCEVSSPSTVAGVDARKSVSTRDPPVTDTVGEQHVNSSTDLSECASVSTEQRESMHLSGGFLMATEQREPMCTPVDISTLGSTEHCERVDTLTDLGGGSLLATAQRELMCTPIDLSTLGFTERRERADTPTDLSGGTLVATEECEHACHSGSSLELTEQLGNSYSVVCQEDASSSLDTSVDSCDDTLYIHIPVEETC